MTGPSAKFQLLSDLHLEFPSHNPPHPSSYAHFNIPPRAPYLILAGDIGVLKQHTEFEAFLKRHLPLFKATFLVLGNHEFYGMEREEGMERAREMEWRLTESWGSSVAGKTCRWNDGDRAAVREGVMGQFFLLNRNRVDLPEGVSVLGCILHSFIPDDAVNVRHFLNDFRMVGNWTPEKHTEEFRRDVQYIEDELKRIKTEKGPTQKVLAVSHYAPTFENTSKPEYYKSPLSTGFATELLDGDERAGVFFERWEGSEQIKAWCFGHTHYCTDWMWRDRVRIVANQRGYLYSQSNNENTGGFKVDFTFKI